MAPMPLGATLLATPETPATEAFDRENRPLLLARVRFGAWLGAIVILVFIPVDAVRLPDAFLEATTIRLLGAAAVLLAVPLSQRAGAERWAVALAAWVVAALAVIDVLIMRYSASALDPAYVLQVVGMIFLVLGASLVLPMDGLRMFAIVVVPFVLHAFASARFDTEANLPFVFATFVAAIIATIGAHASWLTRLADFEHRRAKEDLLRAQDEFVATISHDIRNPIGVIQGYAAILKESETLDDDARECVSRLESAAGTALLLANNVLEVARLQAEPPRLRPEPHAIDGLLDRALEGQRLFFEAKDVRLDVEVAAPLPRAALDAPQIERVLANLLTNALKFTPNGGHVRVEARAAAGGIVRIHIEDSGEGIPAGAEEAIFQRFTRVSDRRDSTGLGLYISRAIVGAHGGRLFAENRSDARGARFVLELPLEPSPAATPG